MVPALGIDNTAPASRRESEKLCSAGWGYYPSGGLGRLLLILLVLAVQGKL